MLEYVETQFFFLVIISGLSPEAVDHYEAIRNELDKVGKVCGDHERIKSGVMFC